MALFFIKVGFQNLASEKRFGDQFCKHSASAYINKDIPAIQRGVCNLSPAALLLFLTHSALRPSSLALTLHAIV